MNSSLRKIADELIVNGKTFSIKGLWKSALLSFNKACTVAPDYLQPHLYLADALHASGKIDEALSLYSYLLSKFPPSHNLLHNYGVSLLSAGKYPDAEEAFERALEIIPDLSDSLVPLSTAVMRQGRYYDALNICERVISAENENAEAHWNRSLILLSLSDLSAGFHEYEWRWKKKGFTSPSRYFNKPLWNGDPAQSSIILVYAEQGFGDTIQFCRYILLLEKICKKVIFECHPELAALMLTLSDKIEVISFGSAIPDFDFQIPLMSLPKHFTLNLSSIPCTVPYLKSAGERVLLPAIKPNRLNGGICWQGKSYPDPDRSCPYNRLMPLLSLSDVNWFSLNVGTSPPSDSPLIVIDWMISDFHDTAAIIDNLDFVVSIDSAVAHLAGAMGKPVFLILQKYPDWRWFLDRDDSPWYPDMHLIRQKTPGIWDDVIIECRDKVMSLMSNLSAAGDGKCIN